MPQFESYDRVTPEDISLKDTQYSERSFVKESYKDEARSAKEALEALWGKLSNKEKETTDVKETINNGINLIKESLILQVLESKGVHNVPHILRSEQGIPGSASGFIKGNKLENLVTGKNQSYLFTSIAVEKIEGQSWFGYNFLTENGKVDERALLEASLKAAQIFDAIFKAGFIHNYIKPDNLMISNDGEVTVIDFNGAEKHDHGVCWSKIGTPQSAAPERSAPKVTDEIERSRFQVTGDIYSFAMTIAEKAGVDIELLADTAYAPERRRQSFLQNIEQKVAHNQVSEKLAVFLMWNTGEENYRNSSFSECVEVLRLVLETHTTAKEIQNFFLSTYRERQKEITED